MLFYKSLPGCRAYHDHSVQLNKDDWEYFRLTVLAKKIVKRPRYLLNIQLFVKFVQLSVKTVSEQRMNYSQIICTIQYINPGEQSALKRNPNYYRLVSSLLVPAKTGHERAI